MLAQSYAAMIGLIDHQCYFLWDPLKDALILELKARNWDLFVELCNLKSDSSSKREMLIEVLTEYGHAWPTNAEQIVRRLIGEEQHIDAPLISIESSYRLKDYDVLKRMALHPNADIRHVTARFINYLSKDNRTAAFNILNYWAERTRKRLVPNMRAVDFCLQASYLILFNAFVDLAIVERLRRVWVTIIDNLFYRDWDDRALVGTPIRKVREFIVKLLVRSLLISIFRVVAKNHMDTYRRIDYEAFFRSKLEIKHRFARLVDYIDPKGRDLDEIDEDLKAIIQNGDHLSIYLMVVILAVRSMEYNFKTSSPTTNPIIPKIVELLNYGIDQQKSSISVPYLIITLGSAGLGYDADYVDKDLISLFSDSLERYYQVHQCRSMNHRGHELKMTGFGQFTQLLYLHDRQMKSPLIMFALSDAIAREDHEFLKRYVYDVLDYSGNRNEWAMLKGVEPLLTMLVSMDHGDLKEELQPAIVEALSTLYFYAPKKVTEFLEEFDQSDFIINVKKRVLSSERKEDIGAMLMGRGATFMRGAVFLNPDKFLLEQLIWLLKQAPKCKSFSQWAEVTIKLIINLIYMPDDEAVFATPNLLQRGIYEVSD